MERMEPAQALERLFEVIREEAAANPKFATRMLEASGVTVAFTGPEAAIVADPVISAARLDYASYCEMFQTFSESDLKKMLKGYSLATDEQVRGVTTKPKKIGLVDLLWAGARRKIDERSIK